MRSVLVCIWGLFQTHEQWVDAVGHARTNTNIWAMRTDEHTTAGPLRMLEQCNQFIQTSYGCEFFQAIFQAYLDVVLCLRAM